MAEKARDSRLAGVTLFALTGTTELGGGAERAFRSIIHGIRDTLGMRVIVATHLPLVPGSDVVPDHVLRENGRPAGPHMIVFLRRLIRALPPDAVLFPFMINSNILMSLANASLPRRARRPVIVNDRANVIARVSPGPGAGLMARLRMAVVRVAARIAYRRASVIVCNAEANEALVRGFIGPGGPRITTIYNPLDAVGLAQKYPARDHGTLSDPQRPLIVGHGRLVQGKSRDVLLRAAAIVKRTWPGVRVRLVGDGPELEPLRALASELSISDAVEFTGYALEPLPLLMDADVYVLSSQSEGLPNALLEAIALGLPAVSTDCPTGPREILGSGDDACGLLVPVDDVEAMAAALAKLLGDDALRARLGRRALERARYFTLDRCVERYRELLEGLV